MALVASEAGGAAFEGSAVLDPGSNAALPSLRLADAARFEAWASSAAGNGWMGVRFFGPDAQVFQLEVNRQGEPLASGASFDLANAKGVSLGYEIEGRAYRTWSAKSGTLVLDSVTATEVVAHVEGARMVPGEDQRCLDDYGCVQNSARGAFVLDFSTRIPVGRGQVRFETVGESNFEPLTLGKENGAFEARSTASTLEISAGEAGTGREVRLWLFPPSRSVRVGDAFTLGRGKNVGSVVAYGADGSHQWSAASGTASVRAIRGRELTIEMQEVRFVPKERATGEIVVGGTVTVLLP